MHVVPSPVPRPRLSFLIALALVIAVGAGCHVGSAEPADGPGTGTGGVDAASAPTGDASTAPAGDGGGGAVTVPDDCVDFAAAPPPKAHNASYDYDQGGGNGCIGMCHVDGADQGETYTLAGAVYDAVGDAGGAVAGAHIFVTDAAGKSLDLITSATGEFFTAEALEFPVTTLATGCPGRLAMISMTTGNCNGGAACHSPTFKINLPPP